ncbi:Nitric oxide reductase activation protein NorE [Lunatimonas lonarensis]|uniref:Nitric oxide reductase activation protein NorE n=1 Tax=Lunatimonas lonarensis TaxID=1232681 RepID=R7ZPF1_9BACT|nr:cytochrome c oxidase subunit 3 [Lunatimonas lonarensis]EON75938.1 Nitric oxide reductase activation protein NorE [Lunatimonas lonarensis]
MENRSAEIEYKNLIDPPGGLLLWMIILLELTTFGLGIGGLVYYGALEPELFSESRKLLNTPLATANTIVLLVSGYFMAQAVYHFKNQAFLPAGRSLNWTVLGGLVFTMLKNYEYVVKLKSGFEIGDNMFFTFYWLLTGFHLVHILVGVVILLVLGRVIRVNPSGVNVSDLEAGAAFWHMCDLIWLLIFPVLYLIF